MVVDDEIDILTIVRRILENGNLKLTRLAILLTRMKYSKTPTSVML